MSLDGEYFQQNFGIIMGTNVAPIEANIYVAMLENQLCNKCAFDPKFKSFIEVDLEFLKEQKRKRNMLNLPKPNRIPIRVSMLYIDFDMFPVPAIETRQPVDSCVEEKSFEPMDVAYTPYPFDRRYLQVNTTHIQQVN